MAGRGRGGGAGRGRGRGAMSFNVEQLGFGTGEALPGPVLQPPPVYPLMEYRPAPLESGPEVEYWLALKREYIEFLHDSPAYLLPVAAKADIERYSDRYQTLDTTTNKGNGFMKYDLNRLPLELRPTTKDKGKKKRKIISPNIKPVKISKVEDINNRLEELEKHEQQEDEEEGEPGETKEDEKEGDAEDGEEVEEEEEMDEEMDDGTDYVNNYFDNGESYVDEEDDNLDDGPVY